ncbi:MAG: cation transporter [Firmicutes bacterium HGW-Firmicutes-14]|nr:MAG: cation transporter [Firmicutes bacterium HGW-Firmicutes-14]
MLENYKKVKQVLWIILLANLAVAVLKIIVGTIIKSAGMTADGFHSLTDGSSNIIGLIGISFAAKGVDEDHPYGHKKYETLAGLFIAGMLLVISGKIVLTAVSRILNPVKPDITVESIIILVVTLIINIFISIFELRQGKKLNSLILVSDSIHTRSDVYVSTGVLISLFLIKAGMPVIIDPVVSLLVSGFILYAAYNIFKSARDILVDRATVDTEKIRAITMNFEHVEDVHKIRSRGCQNDLFVDMHIKTDAGMTVEESHLLIHNIERKIQEEIKGNIQVIIHIEPCDSDVY